MLVARRLKHKDINNKVNELLGFHKVKLDSDENNITYILEDNDRIIGICQAEKYMYEGVLKYLLINTMDRGNNLGDGLLKATLNYLFVNGIEKVYFEKCNNYLIKKGFKVTNNSKEIKEAKHIKVNDKFLVCQLNNFFKQCSCNNN